MKKYITPCLIFGLLACDILTPTEKICTQMARSRLKHPSSYDHILTTETKTAKGQIKVKIDFNAWNDFKVPLPHNTTCLFQEGTLTSVIWNGRPIRQHELDEIKAKVE